MSQPTPKHTKRSAGTSKASPALTADERAAMKELVQERKAAARGEDGERAVLARIAEMPEADRAMAERIHAIVKATAPSLTARTYYGMPAYAQDGRVLCFFQSAAKFKSRYATVGFTDAANLDNDNMFPTSFGLKDLTSAEEERIAALIGKAVS